jgi:hypothetical protein
MCLSLSLGLALKVMRKLIHGTQIPVKMLASRSTLGPSKFSPASEYIPALSFCWTSTRMPLSMLIPSDGFTARELNNRRIRRRLLGCVNKHTQTYLGEVMSRDIVREALRHYLFTLL